MAERRDFRRHPSLPIARPTHHDCPARIPLDDRFQHRAQTLGLTIENLHHQIGQHDAGYRRRFELETASLPGGRSPKLYQLRLDVVQVDGNPLALEKRCRRRLDLSHCHPPFLSLGCHSYYPKILKG